MAPWKWTASILASFVLLAPLVSGQLALGSAFETQGAELQAPSESQKIESLLAAIEGSGLAVIRNGDRHTAIEGAKHLRTKLKAAGSRIRTAREFIEQVASKSSLSGKAYLVVLADGSEETLGTWLAQKLGELESTTATTAAVHEQASQSPAIPPRSDAPGEIFFKRFVLSGDFTCEGAAFADFDRDGAFDVAAGPWWWQGPEFVLRTELYPPQLFDPKGYSDNFFGFARDFNRDDWVDLLVVGFPGKEAFWLENPQGIGKHWGRHPVLAVVDNESPAFEDITGDGRPELVCMNGGRLGWAAPDAAKPNEPWTFHALSEVVFQGPFVHGLGVGDVNGDGRKDVLEKSGWWEQPAALAGDPPWTRHAFPFSAGQGGAQMYTYDVDGDGDADVITSLNAHGFGLVWFEQVKKGGALSFVEHVIMGDQPPSAPGEVRFAELHAMALCDVNGDGLQDIVTGKRWWSHGAAGDPEPGAPPVIYWFELARDKDKGVSWIPRRIDADSGVGVQLVASDIDGDARADVLSANKKGVHVFLQWDPVELEIKQSLQDEPHGLLPKPKPAGGNIPPPKPKSGDKPPAAADSKQATLDRTGLPMPPTLDFESGDLRGWTATGKAFDGQPIRGDTVSARGREPSRHAGDWWIGGYEKHGDGPTGTLSSQPFPASAPWASFLVGGGGSDTTRVELWEDGRDKPFFKTSGVSYESLQRVTVDLAAVAGKQIHIRLVDESAGGWGHVNFDDFQLHASQPSFPPETEAPAILPADVVAHSGLSPAEAPAAMTVPQGFQVELIASEPELHQPVALAIDAQGRLWVAEAFTYPERAPDGEGQDDILVFEDTDHDGNFETRTVFARGLNLVSGLEVGFGGVWVGAAPYLLYIPDKDGDLVPDGEPEILLDGFGYQDTHETLNAFTFGPDGWLYGCHGVFTHSRVGKPGTPDAEREPMNAAVWRYQPLRREFEIFAWGTSNPWGVDFDEHGQAFITACVIPHLFHMVQGGRYIRQAGAHFDAHVYGEIDTIADHRHYLGETPHGGNKRSNAAGGGHAHCGAMIYLGDSFPQEFRGRLYMSNIHGNRINVDELERKGSGFAGRHGEDFVISNDEWFRGINLKYGPDGAVYLIDWYDKQACHDTRTEKWDRTNGRLFRVSYGKPKPSIADLAALSDVDLVELQKHESEWFARRARTLLQERGAGEKARSALLSMLKYDKSEVRRLRALWTLHALGGLSEELLLSQFDSGMEYLRAWTVQLMTEGRQVSDRARHDFVRQARNDKSPVVRLYLASALQRLPLRDRWEIAEALSKHGEDAEDPNLPLMIWYGIEPLVADDPKRALDAFAASPLETLRRFSVRRAGADAKGREALITALAATRDSGTRGWMLDELSNALAEHPKVEMPAGWPALYKKLSADDDASVRERALWIAASFGDAQAAEGLLAILRDSSQESARRVEALDALLRVGGPALGPTLIELLDVAALQGQSLRALASVDDPRVPGAILSRYARFSADEKRDALGTLSSRASYACELLAAAESGSVARADISAFALRQMQELKDAKVSELLARVIGVVRGTPEAKQKRIEELEGRLGKDELAKADLPRGREVYARTCQQCHTLFGAGGNLAPELTGANRGDLDYLLTNMVDPSAVVGRDYQATILRLVDGRVLTGLERSRSADAISLQTERETLSVAIADVEESKLSEISTMADGLLDALGADEVRDLVAYLQGPSQVPLLMTAERAKSAFNGRDLDGWIGAGQSWSVEQGEIVGRTQGLAHNAFLRSDFELRDFRLTLDVKLTGDQGNSGVQFRTEALADGEVKGYQADIGPGWWGKLYEENGRGLLAEGAGESIVNRGEWNRYEIEAIGRRVRTWLNGKPCVDLEDATGPTRGILALQLHSGGPTEVRFRNLELKVLDPDAGH